MASIAFDFGHAELQGQAIEMWYSICVHAVITSFSIPLPDVYVVLRTLKGLTSKYYAHCPVS